MGLKQITGLADAVDDNDAVNKAQLDAAVAAVDLSLYAPKASPTFTGVPAAPTAAAATNTTQLATTAFVTTADNLKANLASPTFTGTPAAPTAAVGTNTTQLATTAFVLANGAWSKSNKTADQSVTSSTTLVDCTSLTFAVAANTNYHFRAHLYMTANTTGGIRLGVNGPSTPTKVRVFGHGYLGGIQRSLADITAYGQIENYTGGVPAAQLYLLHGKLENGANAGTLAIQFAQSVSNATATIVEKCSFIEYSIVA